MEERGFDCRDGSRGVAGTSFQPSPRCRLMTGHFLWQQQAAEIRTCFPFLSRALAGRAAATKAQCCAECGRDCCPPERCLWAARFITISHHSVGYKRKSNFLASRKG